MILKRIAWWISTTWMLASCSILKKSSKTELVDDFYSQHMHGKKQLVYLYTQEDTLCIYPAQKQAGKRMIDTTQSCMRYPTEMPHDFRTPLVLIKPSLDVDFVTIPLKFRLATAQVPQQLNANLNGAVYVGYRVDSYTLRYLPTPLQTSRRNTTHLGASLGAFTGIGNTFMSPTTTNNMLQQEYDGIVWSKGVAGIFAVNTFTLGLAAGFDTVLDQNRKIWIYDSRLWFGLAFGLNLN